MFLSLASPAVLAGGTEVASAASSDRPLGHQLLLGFGVTRTDEDWFEGSLHPGVELGFDIACGGHVAVGLLGDLTSISVPARMTLPARTDHRLITGLELKVLPLRSGSLRPWLAVGLAGSVLDDTGYGWGASAGVFYVSKVPFTLFGDVRRYHVVDMESTDFQQIMFRVGIGY
jgi:hypothetical protein